ncbi:trypsin-like serine peptidase [Streptomyces sp. NBC_00158]|uniref:trypsin-like serine peptidase n=1 Tax=Streptomyces sp. NBC_00158 TaxID=2903627 RepID=UPI003255660B
MTGRAVRVCVLAGVCCALVVAGVGFAVGRFGTVAVGDAERGSYVQGERVGDETAAKALEGLVEGGGERTAAPDGAGWKVSEPLEAVDVEPESAIGALFSPGMDWDDEHHCSGSVVHSAAGDLVVTAAHCVYANGFRTNLAFVPGYADGKAPFGVWVPTRIDVDPRWVSSADPDYDVAFVRVRRPGRPGQRLEDVTGAHPVRFGQQLPSPARLVGYPNDAEQPLGCANTAVAAGSTQLRLDCADVPNGTSGGPVLTAAGTLIGVIGGRDGGGDEVTSYSSYFGDGVRKLYERAVRD